MTHGSDSRLRSQHARKARRKGLSSTSLATSAFHTGSAVGANAGFSDHVEEAEAVERRSEKGWKGAERVSD